MFVLGTVTEPIPRQLSRGRSTYFFSLSTTLVHLGVGGGYNCIRKHYSFACGGILAVLRLIYSKY